MVSERMGASSRCASVMAAAELAPRRAAFATTISASQSVQAQDGNRVTSNETSASSASSTCTRAIAMLSVMPSPPL